MAKDKYHDHVRKALENDGWRITHDPYWINIEGTTYPVDLGGEEIIGAEKGGKKIAVEIKSFLAESLVNEFHTVLGQYLDYFSGIEEQEPGRMIYVAIPDTAWERILKMPFLLRVLARYHVNTVIFETSDTKINQWITR